MFLKNLFEKCHLKTMLLRYRFSSRHHFNGGGKLILLYWSVCCWSSNSEWVCAWDIADDPVLSRNIVSRLHYGNSWSNYFCSSFPLANHFAGILFTTCLLMFFDPLAPNNSNNTMIQQRETWKKIPPVISCPLKHPSLSVRFLYICP